MTDFANYIINEAFYWMRRDCKEHSATPNQSVCVNELKGGVTNEDWCALFVWRCVEDAAKKSGAKNPLQRTPSTIAMLNAARKSGLRISTTPELGSIFWRPRTGGGHVGIVSGMNSQHIFCIEGNTSNRVGMRMYDRSKQLQNYVFIHVQDQPTSRAWSGAPYNLRPTLVEWDAVNVAQAQQERTMNFFVSGAALGAALALGYIIYDNIQE
jgi:hypothetical protein